MTGFMNSLKETAENFTKTATVITNSVVNSAKEQEKIIRLESDIKKEQKKINNKYTEIGKAFAEYVSNNSDLNNFDVSELLNELELEIANKKVLEADLKEIKNRSAVEAEQKKREKANKDFEEEKAKLDKALAMEIISEDDYNTKLSYHQKKLDNYDEINKIEKQYNLGIITFEEKEQKIKDILS